MGYGEVEAQLVEFRDEVTGGIFDGEEGFSQRIDTDDDILKTDTAPPAGAEGFHEGFFSGKTGGEVLFREGF